MSDNVHPFLRKVPPTVPKAPILPTSGDFGNHYFATKVVNGIDTNNKEPTFSQVQLEIIQTYIEQIEILLDGMRRCTKLKV